MGSWARTGPESAVKQSCRSWTGQDFGKEEQGLKETALFREYQDLGFCLLSVE